VSAIDRYIITAIYLRGARKSGGGSEGLREVDLTEGQDGGHEAVAARSDAIEPGAGDLAATRQRRGCACGR
jgi:hypothetical protein